MTIYFGSVITGAPAALLDRLHDYAKHLRACGHVVYVPFEDHSKLDEVYERDCDRMEEADLILEYVGRPSLGVGLELEMARHHCSVPGVRCWAFPEDTVSEFVTGWTAAWDVPFRRVGTWQELDAYVQGNFDATEAA